MKHVGYLGGIVFNEYTGNLIDGHRRVLALDQINKYDGTPETDYEIKVEEVVMDRKTELEQMTYMAVGNSKADYNLVASYIDEMDYKDAGISDDDYQSILDLRDMGMEDIPDMEDMSELFAPKPKKTVEVEDNDEPLDSDYEENVGEEQPIVVNQPEHRAPVEELPTREMTNEEFVRMHEEKPKMTKEEVKEQKEHCRNVNNDYMDKTESYIVISFDNIQAKNGFCEALGFTPKDNMIIKGEDIMNALDL